MSTLKRPTTLDDPRIGIADRADAGFVLAALSRFIASVRGRPPGEICSLGLALEAYAVTEVGRGSGAHPAPFPDLVLRERPKDRKILAKLGVTPAEISRQWQRAELDEGLEAMLPVELVSSLTTVQLFRVVLAVAREGPALAKRRFERALVAKSEQEAPSNRKRRSQGKISHETLNHWKTTFGTLMGHFVDLQSHPSGVAREWTSKPVVRVPRGAPRQVTDTSAPPLPEIRIRMREQRREVANRLGCEVGQELETVKQVPRYRLNGLFRVVRQWAYSSLLLISASRDGAISSALAPLEVAHFDLNHRGPLGVGPAVVIDPKKRAPDETLSWKPLVGPWARAHVAYPIECLLALIERLTGGRPPDHYPLFCAEPSNPSKHWDQDGVARAFSGVKGRRKAFIPFDKSDLSLGYSPHRYRAAATKILESQAAADCLRERPDVDVPQRFLADCLTDHSLSELAAIYNQIGTPQGREEVSGVATEIIAEIVFSERGARKTIDGPGYERGLRRQQSLMAEHQRFGQHLDRALGRVRNGDQAAMADVFEVLHRETELAQELARLEVDIERIRKKDPMRFAAILDDAPDSALHVDLDEIERRVLGREMPAGGRPQTMPAVRDWITVTEVARVAENSTKQSRLWTDGKGLPGSAGSDRRPWEPDRVPVDATLGPNRRRILVRGINSAWLDTVPRRRERLAEILKTWPAGWSEKFWQPNAVAPEWMEDELSARRRKASERREHKKAA